MSSWLLLRSGVPVINVGTTQDGAAELFSTALSGQQ